MQSQNTTSATGVLARLRALLTDHNFLVRIISALVLIPIVLAEVYLGGWWFTALIVIVVILAVREWSRMIITESAQLLSLLMMLLCAAIVIASAPMPDLLVSAILIFGAFALTLGFSLVAKKSWIVSVGLPYLLIPAISMMWLRGHDDGFRMIIYLFFVVWATDTGAYLVGRIVGGPKLAPLISPKKTWSGAIGGTLTAAITGLVVALLYHTELPLVAFGVALLLAIITQLGDLFESAIKRRYAVKDSGGTIPGHGGILDRIDGLLAAAAGLAMFHGLLLAIGYDWW